MVFAIRNIAIVALLGFLCNCCGCIQDAEFVMGSVQEGAIGPQYQDGLIVNFFASGKAAEAKIRISYSGSPVYEKTIPAGKGAVEEKIEYCDFLVGNGNYDVSVEYSGKSETRPITLNRWVNSLWIEATPSKINASRSEMVHITLIPLFSDCGGRPTDYEFITSGIFNVGIYHGGITVHQLSIEYGPGRSKTVVLPVNDFYDGAGEYGIVAVFVNSWAKNNACERMDPSLRNRNVFVVSD